MAYLANIKHNSLKYLTAEDFYDYIIAEFGPFQMDAEKIANQTKQYYADKKKQSEDSGVTTIPTTRPEADDPKTNESEVKEQDNGGKEDNKADSQAA